LRSPSHPAYYWGNLLSSTGSREAGDAPRWEALFDGALFAENRGAASHARVGRTDK
jgi:hypothetical protein